MTAITGTKATVMTDIQPERSLAVISVVSRRRATPSSTSCTEAGTTVPVPPTIDVLISVVQGTPFLGPTVLSGPERFIVVLDS